MEEQMNKTKLLNEDNKAYTALVSILNSLDEAKMTTAGVNGEWSIKDILAHLTSWHIHFLNLMHAVVSKKEPALNHDEGKGIDEINEQFFEENRSRPLDEVLRSFRETHRQIIEEVQQMSDEQLNIPPWSDSDHALWEYFAGNTYEHYEEHMKTIQLWLGIEQGQ